MEYTIKSQVSKEIDKLADRIIEISDSIHDEPELGYQEFKASALLTSELLKFGFTVEKGLADLPTSFRASLKGKIGGPTVAFLAEYDALPELGHACGHNIIAAAAVGAAIGVSRVMNDIAGTLIVFGTPAEEGYTQNAGGKIIMLEEIKAADVVLMIHPGPRYQVDSPSLAREAFEVSFEGRAAHAGVSPEEGINALEGVLLTFQGINALRQHVTGDIRIHGIITEGGVSPNIIPEHASAHLYVRAPTIQILEETVEKVKNCARGASLATGAEVKFRKTANTYANIKPNKTLSKIFRENLVDLGVEFPEDEEKKLGGSTDFGNVSQIVPAVSAWISLGEDLVLHSPEATKVTASGRAHEAVIIASKALAHTAFDLYTVKSLMDEVKSEFQGSI